MVWSRVFGLVNVASSRLMAVSPKSDLGKHEMRKSFMRDLPVHASLEDRR